MRQRNCEQLISHIFVAAADASEALGLHRFAPDPTLTDGESLYEAAFGPDEWRTDFWDATAQTEPFRV
ncbi:hypothetical protein [Mycolicibacterium moriokaense]|uniref:Uncharacterized protein n=1 Tax=Mycolicibacterium moriokaense TaxID=39691 RepID=A0A318H174_9MYCO|nr:hypothetical protein [Mycolicibacterium moriokaense]PXW96095.1 hypothetical protein C8E89_15414 [Mycolicibacterium moriokaense]